MTSPQPFSDRVVSHLRLVDYRLRTSEPGSTRRRYAICRMALNNITRVDSFYVGFFHGVDSLVIPYIYDHDRHLQPDVAKYGKGGLSHWVRSSGRAYVYSSDNGGLLNRTIPFGDPDEESKDAVIVPLRDADSGETTGLMSIQSLTPDVYDDEVVQATQWIADAMMLAQARDRHSGAFSDSLYHEHPELNTAIAGDPQERFAQISDQLAAAYRRSGEISAAVERLGNESLVRDASNLRTLLEQIQGDIAELLLSRPPEGDGVSDVAAGARHDLTPREVEIATLIATEHLTNSQIAQTLQISLKTVKTHVGNILAKLGVSQRSAIVFAMADFLAQPAARSTQRS